MAMNETHVTEEQSGGLSREELLSAQFAQMVVQQANMAMMLMGKTPHPQTGRAMHDLESARMFIDQLEMLEAKTKGNLTKEEQTLLKQSLLSLHMAFVEAAESPGSSGPDSAPAAPEAPSESSGVSPESTPASGIPASDAESKKKFSKKY
jgi:hypothetical protein